MNKALIPLAILGVCLGCKGQSGTDTAVNSPATTPPASGQGTPAAGGSQFALVSDVLNKNCAGCHGDKRAPGGIHLTSYAGVIKGGEDGAIVKAGDAKGSVLVQALRGQGRARKMPPNGPGLSDAQIKVVEDWITAGAKS